MRISAVTCLNLHLPVGRLYSQHRSSIFHAQILDLTTVAFGWDPNGGERGFLGLAFAPNFLATGHIYTAMIVNDGVETQFDGYADVTGAMRIARFTIIPGASNADTLGTQVTLMQWPHNTYIHKGGEFDQNVSFCTCVGST